MLADVGFLFFDGGAQVEIAAYTGVAEAVLAPSVCGGLAALLEQCLLVPSLSSSSQPQSSSDGILHIDRAPANSSAFNWLHHSVIFLDVFEVASTHVWQASWPPA